MKTRRHNKIIEIIKEFDIETQEELANKLKEAGFEVTQATISRDIRELKLTKVVSANGKQKYDIFLQDESIIHERLEMVFKQGVTDIDYAQNMLVIKTLNGMAMGVAAALDNMVGSEMMGSIAGDDTIFCVVKTEEKALEIMEKLREKLN